MVKGFFLTRRRQRLWQARQLIGQLKLVAFVGRASRRGRVIWEGEPPGEPRHSSRRSRGGSLTITDSTLFLAQLITPPIYQ